MNTYLILGIFFGVCLLIILLIKFRTEIKVMFIRHFYPERVIRLVIHYPNNKYTSEIRMIPEDRFIEIGSLRYYYDKEATLKHKDMFGYMKKRDKQNLFFNVDNKEYKYDIEKLEKNTKENTELELHYWYNIPTPINFNLEHKSIEISAKQQGDMKRNDLFAKLLTLEDQNMLILIAIIVSAIALLCAGFGAYHAYKTHKLLDDYIKMVTAPAQSSILLWGFVIQKRRVIRNG